MTTDRLWHAKEALRAQAQSVWLQSHEWNPDESGDLQRATAAVEKLTHAYNDVLEALRADLKLSEPWRQPQMWARPPQ